MDMELDFKTRFVGWRNKGLAKENQKLFQRMLANRSVGGKDTVTKRTTTELK